MQCHNRNSSSPIGRRLLTGYAVSLLFTVWPGSFAAGQATPAPPVRSIERPLPGNLTEQAASLRTAARAAFSAADLNKGREHLRALLALYRQARLDARNPTELRQWTLRLSEVAHEYLRGGQIEDATELLGEAADLNLPYREGQDDRLASAAAGWYRRLAGMDSSERFELLHEWTMPTESRRTVRVLTSMVPNDAPPREFARALGERPRDDSFPVAGINGIDGLFSTAWLLVKSAEETGRLRRLIVDLTELSSDGVPNADYVLMLARLVGEQNGDKQLEESLVEHLELLQRKRSPKLVGKGPVPRELSWQFGYTEVDAEPRRIDFKPLPFWTGSAWQGSADYPDPTLGWTMMDATGGHTEQQLSPVRRWVAPADGTLAVVGAFAHIYDNGDGVRARVVSSRSGLSGEWKTRNNSVSTIVESLDVSAWDAIDFVVDRIETNNWDRFHWPVQLTLTTRDGEVLKYESASVDMAPTTESSLADVALAAACFGHDRLQPFGESMVERLLENASRGPSSLLRPLLQRAHAVAVAGRRPGADLTGLNNARPLHWLAANGDDSALNARGGSRAIWLTHEQHLLQLSGGHSSALLFRYPLTGEFEFSCEAQQGGSYPTDGGLVYGGLQFLAHSGQQELTVYDADASRFESKPCPFLRRATDAVFNRLSIRTTAAGAIFAVNGHPVWEDSQIVELSPWIGLCAFGDRRPLFRNLKISGSPVIPRKVRLVDDEAMRGWQSTYFGEGQTPFMSAAIADKPPFDWHVSDGNILNAKRVVEVGANPQSLLRYQRPLLDGESISYEFYYKPGEFVVHPSLGRLAFLIEPRGVRLHWMTDGENEWTGLSDDNAIVEPLNRRGPKTLPLQSDDWNRLTISLTNDTVTLSLNDEVIYERSRQPESGRQFGLFHDRRRSAVRVRNVAMTGAWPEKLSDEVLTDLAIAPKSDRSDADSAFLADVFSERDLARNVFAARARSAALSDEERFTFLSDWVLPNRDHRSFRLGGAFTATTPAPSDAASRADVGGQLVVPAYDLIDVAVRLDRLDQLRERLVAADSRDGDQQRARFALLFLVEAAGGDLTAAAAACEQLLALREQRNDFSVETLWPESLVAVRGYHNPATRAMVSELCSHLFDNLLQGRRSGLTALDCQLMSLLGKRSAEVSGESSDAPSSLANWIPASVQTAKTRGAGHPPVRWRRRGERIDKVTPHDCDLLYYRIPMTGDFDVQCTASPFAMQQVGLMYGGLFQEFVDSQIRYEGTLRSRREATLSPSLSRVGQMVRMRIRVRDGVCTTFFNGREVSQRELPEHYDPWLAVYSGGGRLSRVSDLRITGNPVVPSQVELTADKQLLGWVSYFGDDVGTAENNAPWRRLDDPVGGIVGARQAALAGSCRESLLQYHRPLAEDGVLAYEFYYIPGEVHAHPALDRLAFILDPRGVTIHWVTDGADATEAADPTNRAVEPQHRRGPQGLPLRPNQWNEMTVTLRGDTVGLTLNGELIYERPLEITNQRTFGLFHFADQTEVRVRGVTLRGAWPKSVPPVADQELADKTLSSLDETRPKLPAAFSHSFAAGAVPAEYFRLVPSSPEQRFAIRADGLFTSTTARGAWASFTILPRFAVHGDFDIEVGFDQLKLRGDQTVGVLLYTDHADEQRPWYRIMRMQEQSHVEQLHASLSLLHSNGNRTFDSPQFESCESTAGRLRLARRDHTIYYLYADDDSTAFRVVGAQPGSAAESVPEGIQIQAIGNGASDASVVWKNISIRAEKMTYLPPDDGPPTRKLIVMNVDGSDAREVAGPPEGYTNLGSPEWSADGRQMTFDATPGDFAGTHVIAVNTDGTGVRDCGLGAMPSFSPDGKQIVYCQSGGGVMMMSANGSNRKQIDPGGWGAQWSPDGRWIAWGRGGNNIIVMDAKTKEQKPLLVGEQATLFSSTYWNLGWSHDSRSIAFKARNLRTGGDDIVVADIDSPDGFKILLASCTGVQPDFSFSPDNKRILFAMHNADQKTSKLYTIGRDNADPPKLLPGQPVDWMIYNGDWSADGKKIAFTGEKIPQPLEWPLADDSKPRE